MCGAKTSFPRRNWVLTLTAALAILVSLPGHARLYKWTDANGNVIYSQTPPPVKANAGHTELNKRGLKMRDVERPLTAQERAALEAKAQLEKELAVLKQRQEIEDRQLLIAFPSIGALESARDMRLSTLDQKIRYLSSRRSDSSEKLQVNDQRIVNFQRKKLKVPEQLVIEKITLGKVIQTFGEQIANLELERAVVASQFAADRARYLQILANRKLQALSSGD